MRRAQEAEEEAAWVREDELYLQEQQAQLAAEANYDRSRSSLGEHFL